VIKKYFFVLNTFFGIISLNAQDNYIQKYEYLVSKTHAERTLLLSEFYDQDIRNLDSITIFENINAIKGFAKKANDDELILEMELLQLHYYTFRKKFSKNFTVDKIKALYEIAKGKNILWLEIRTQSLLANYLYHYHQEYGLGFEYYKKTAKLLENISIEDFPLKQICLIQIAYVHSEFREYEKTINYLKKAKKLESKYNSAYYSPHINNTLADSYAQLKQIDSSNYYHRLNLQRAITKKDAVWIGISVGNLGANHLARGNYKKALPLLLKSVKLMENAKDWSFASGRSSDLGQTYLGLNDVVNARKAAEKSTEYARKSNVYYRLLNLYKLKLYIATKEFKPKIAARYIDSVFVVKDSLAKVFNRIILIRAEQKIVIEKQRLEKEKERQENLKKILFRNTLIALLGILIVCMFLKYSRNKKKALNNEKKILLEKNRAEEELSFASQKLKKFTNSIISKNRKIEELEKVINDKLKQKENGVNDLKSSINQLKKSSILTDQDWYRFVAVFKQVNPIFFDNLNVKYPKITPSEIRLLALSKLELDNKQMALMLGIGPNAIRQIKSRFFKKYHLNKDISLLKIVKPI
jgi:DNA-binding CsgD family transcriptional regulator/cbb3-type cytochrome oxidase subunit 3